MRSEKSKAVSAASSEHLMEASLAHPFFVRKQLKEKLLVGQKMGNKIWGMSAEGFRGHVTIGGSLLGVPGRWGACGWSVVQLDHDEVEASA